MTRRTENSLDPQGTSQDRGVLDEALEPAQIRSLNSALRKLTETDGVSKELQGVAKRLLSGRLTLRDALDDPAAAHALGAGMASLRGQWEALSEEEREQIRQGEAAASGELPPGAAESRGSAGAGASSHGGRKSPGRHSGGFSLY
ncbi:hypothetical protein [Streptomyces sp. NPDC046805]|uniref:hypothetical protein n=1 Tax=Streptomyces sp. NPDC046805 TaxID=3155134 RepID=UPI0033D724F9